MAGVGGFFLQGLGEGIQTGFQMGQQTKEWNWQKKEKERIQKEKDDVMEAASAFNKKIEGYYADGTLSDDEKLQLNTMYMASGYNIQEIIKGSYDAVMKMDKDTEEHNLAWLKSYRESLGDLDPSSIPELYEYTKSQMIGEKGKAMFVAGDSLLKKKYETLQGQQPEGYNSPDELLKVHPGADWEFNASLKKYIVKPLAKAAEPSALSAKDNWAIEHYNLPEGSPEKISFNQLSRYMGATPETPEKATALEQEISAMKAYGASNEEIKNKLIGKSGGGIEKARVTSLPQQEEYRNKALNAESWEEAQGYINDYKNAGYDETQLGVTQQDWANAKKQNMDAIVTMLNNITPNGKLQKDTEYTFVIDGKDVKKTGGEWYKYLYQFYQPMLDILKSNGVDISIYPVMQPFEEITRGFWGKFNERVKKYGETLKK